MKIEEGQHYHCLRIYHGYIVDETVQARCRMMDMGTDEFCPSF